MELAAIVAEVLTEPIGINSDSADDIPLKRCGYRRLGLDIGESFLLLPRMGCECKLLTRFICQSCMSTRAPDLALTSPDRRSRLGSAQVRQF